MSGWWRQGVFVASSWAPFLFFMVSPLMLFPLILLLIICPSSNYLFVFSKVHQGESEFLAVDEKVCLVQLSKAPQHVAHCQERSMISRRILFVHDVSKNSICPPTYTCPHTPTTCPWELCDVLCPIPATSLTEGFEPESRRTVYLAFFRAWNNVTVSHCHCEC